MEAVIIITFCTLLLIAYVFDLTASKTKIPSVIVLLLLGWLVRQLVDFWEIRLPDFSILLPVLGTVGLILIVLDGTLDLNFDKSKVSLIKKSFFGAFFNILITSFIFSLLFMQVGDSPLRDRLMNAIPFCIISSAIAIPSVGHITKWKKEFVIYESSFSDILGVLFFTFITINEVFNFHSYSRFVIEIVLMLFISLLATIALAFLLNKIQHHIKFIPIILLAILIYAIAIMFQLPALIFILLFGLFLGNIDKIKVLKKIEKVNINIIDNEVVKFKELTQEATFLVRTIFFLVFGYFIETKEILNPSTLEWSLVFVALIFVIRAIQLKISKLPLNPLLFIAPRGLVTILLFLSINPANQLMIVNKSLMIQVIILTSLVMMIGLIFTKKDKTVIAGQESNMQDKIHTKKTQEQPEKVTVEDK